MIGIVFSHNSPENLEQFIQSKNKYEISLFELNVLYYATDLNDEKYKEIFEKYSISKHKRIDVFKDDLMASINSATDLVGFFKDTNHFFSSLPESNIESVMSNDDIFCFSLILGRNIKHCYYNDVYNILLNEESVGDNSITWNWTKHYLDFGRPLELGGGHIFHKKEIYKLFKKWNYNDIPELEASFDNLDYYPKELMASFTNSILVDVLNKDNHFDKLNTLNSEVVDRIVIEI